MNKRVYFFIVCINFLKKIPDDRTPEWLKKMFSTITKSERNGPVFRFFMDLGDAGMHW